MPPVTMHVEYWPTEGNEAELQTLVQKHWPTLKDLGLVTDTPATLWRATDKESSRSFFVEIFSWNDENASDVAHQTPEVMAIWEPMGPILEKLRLTRLEPLSQD